MNIAVVISVSNYTKDLDALPGCQNDFKLIKHILELTKKYDKIFYDNSNSEAGIIGSVLVIGCFFG